MATTHYTTLGISSPVAGDGFVRYCVRDARRVSNDYVRRIRVDQGSCEPQGSADVRADVEEWYGDRVSAGSLAVGLASGALRVWRW